MREISPFTHVKDKETEGAKDNGPNLLPVDWQTVPLCLVLENKKGGQNLGLKKIKTPQIL